MPLNFLNPVKQEYVSEYIPAPVQEIAQTGEVLQNRYDVVRDNFDKLRVLAKNKRSLAGDKSVVDNAIGKIEEQFKTYSKSGNFEDADFVVNQLATDFVTDKELQDAEMSYKGYQEALAQQQKLQGEGNQNYFFNNIDPSSYSTAKQGVYRGDVQQRLAHEDEMKKVMGVIGEDSKEGQIKYITNLDVPPEVKKAFLQAITTAGVSKNKIDSVGRALLPVYLQSNSGKQLYRALKEGQEEFLTGAKTAEEEIYNRLKQSAYNQQSSKVSRQFVSAPTDNKSSGRGKFSTVGNTAVVNTLQDAYGGTSEKKELRTSLVTGLTSEKAEYKNVLSFADAMINRAKTVKDKPLEEKYSTFRELIEQTNTLPEKDKKAVAEFFTMGLWNDDARIDLLPAKVVPLVMKLSNYTNTNFFDTDTEDAFTDFMSEEQGSQQINLVAPSVLNSEGSNKLQTMIKNSLSNNDFIAYKGKIKPETDYTFSKVSDKPLGSGTGVVIELKDPKTQETILVEPKDDRMLDDLELIFPNISVVNQFKQTKDFRKNESRDVKSIFQENQLAAPTGVENYKIQYKDNLYYLLSPNGKVVNMVDPETGKKTPASSTHYLDLIMQL